MKRKMKTVAFNVPDDKDLNTLLKIIKKFGYKPHIEVSTVKEPSVQLKKAIGEVEKGHTVKCSNVGEMMEKLNE
jgi:hypothetical protein